MALCYGALQKGTWLQEGAWLQQGAQSRATQSRTLSGKARNRKKSQQNLDAQYRPSHEEIAFEARKVATGKGPPMDLKYKPRWTGARGHYGGGADGDALKPRDIGALTSDQLIVFSVHGAVDDDHRGPWSLNSSQL